MALPGAMLLAWLAGLPLAPPAGAQSYEVTELALVGEVAPGSGGGSYQHFFRLSANDRRQVAFIASVTGGSATKGVFLVTDGVAAPVALVGDPAPDSGGASYADFGGVSLDVDGAVAFAATLSGGSAGGGLFLVDAGGVRAVAVAGDPAPSGVGSYAGVPFLDRHGLNDQGTLGFASQLSGGSASWGAFTDAGGSAAVVAVSGDPAPGTGASFSVFGPPALNQAGEAAFLASTSEGFVGAFLATATAISPLAVESFDLPVFYIDVFGVDLRGGDRVVWWAAFGGDPVEPQILERIRAGTKETAVEWDDRAPVPADLSCDPNPCHPWFDSFQEFSVDAEGRIAVAALLDNDDYLDPDGFYGIFVLPPTSVETPRGPSDARTVVLQGDVAPGTGGTAFAEFDVPELGARAVAFRGDGAAGQLGLFLALPTTPPLPALSAPGLAGLAGALAATGALLSALRGGAGRRRRG
jgi:hypothetical protein